MTARPRRTTTLVGPNRLVLTAATAGLVALASAGTALLVLTGTSSVTPHAAPAPPLPSSSPLSHAPGVVVLPSQEPPSAAHEERPPHHRPVVDVVPAALAFTDVPAPAVAPAVVPPVVVPPVVAPEPPALRRTPEVVDVDTHPGRHLAKGHAKHGKQAKHHKHPKLHGKRVGWAHSAHRGNR